MDGRSPPELADVFFGGVEGVYGPQSASGDDASPQNRSVLRAMHTPTAPKIRSACLGVIAHPFDESARSERSRVGR